tara:strand:+ start:2146 stop:2295 length:150 start_codon:yes stop_codon:yes gene_type:complete
MRIFKGAKSTMLSSKNTKFLVNKKSGRVKIMVSGFGVFSSLEELRKKLE